VLSAGEGGGVGFGEFWVVGVAVEVEVFDLFGVLELVGDDVFGHGATGFFGVDGDEFVGVVFFFFEYRADDLAFDFWGEEGFGVFVGGEVDDRGFGGGVLVEGLVEFVCPKGGFVFHFEAVGLDEVEGSEEAVESGYYSEVVLEVLELGGGVFFGVEVGVDIALEGENGLFGVFWGERGVEVLIALLVEDCEVFTDLHFLAELGDAVFAIFFDELFGFLEKVGDVVRIGFGKGVEVLGFGGRKENNHF
jgi:hypothetical protein